jgi:hypothetical protein
MFEISNGMFEISNGMFEISNVRDICNNDQRSALAKTGDGA